jgi:hypothetical protein
VTAAQRLEKAKEDARTDIFFRSLINLNYVEQIRVHRDKPGCYVFVLYPQQRYLTEEHALELVEAAQLVGAR